MSDKIIRIKAVGTRKVAITDLQNFQGNLKELYENEYIKLRALIIKRGFRFPVLVWKNNILDGHQRIFVVTKMVQDEGYVLEDNIPVVDIMAENEKEAKQLLLEYNSRYGVITEQGLYEFIETNNLTLDDMPEIELPDINLDKFKDNYYNELPQGPAGPEKTEKSPVGVFYKCPKCGHEFK